MTYIDDQGTSRGYGRASSVAQPADGGSSRGIAVQEVSLSYPATKRRSGNNVLDSISFTVEPGEFLVIVGPSGCGKSTLLRIIADLQRPTSGTVTFDGVPAPAHERVGFLFQADALFPWKTALQNVELAIQMGSAASAEVNARDLMGELGLDDACDRYPHQLSGGMRKRVALARTLAYQPTVFLMDEPFGALDAQTRVTVGNFFLRILERAGQSVVFVTHDIEEAVTLADRVIVLSSGPGSKIHDEIKIDIARPRDYYASRLDPAASGYQKRLWEGLGFEDRRLA